MSSTIDVSNPKITVEIVTGGVAVDGSMIFVDVITGILPGVPGPAGPEGPQGPEGIPGVNDVWSRTESDDRYVNRDGDTMSGALVIQSPPGGLFPADALAVVSNDSLSQIFFRIVDGASPTFARAEMGLNTNDLSRSVVLNFAYADSIGDVRAEFVNLPLTYSTQASSVTDPGHLINKSYADSLVAVRPYDLTFDYGTNVIPAGDVASVAITRNIIIPNNFAGSSNVPPLTNGTVSAAVFTVKVNSTVIGTATVSTAGAIAWAFSAPGAPLPVAAGSRLSITGPTPANATLAGLVLTIATTWVP
jgi:hypothetical protein